jgi:5-methylcytosine-specific restriction endonuclease McrA
MCTRLDRSTQECTGGSIPMTTRRGTSNSNERGSSWQRRKRKAWLLETYAANCVYIFANHGIDKTVLIPESTPHASRADARVEFLIAKGLATRTEVRPACRCYRCGQPLHYGTLTVDRIIPGCRGGKYQLDNIRPACGPCNSETGGPLRSV